MPERQTPARPEMGFALLDEALAKYRHEMSQDLEAAQRRYGFTLFHSLTPEEKIAHLKRLGFEPQDETDQYNLGCVAALQGNFAEAAAAFQRALQANPKFHPAAHNLALALERQGRTSEAKAAWRKALDLSPEDGRAAIEAHLAEIA